MVNKVNIYSFGERILEIQFNIHMDREVDEKVISILKNLFKKESPANQLQHLKYILRNKNRMKGGRVNIPKLYEGKPVVYVDYPGQFTDNDKHNFNLTDIKSFDVSEFREASLHETVHIYHVLNGKYAKRILTELLEFDKFKDKKIAHLHLINELNRFSRQCYLEGYAQIICQLGKKYRHNKKSIKEMHDNLMNYAIELNEAWSKFLNKGVKKDLLNLFLSRPYRVGPQLYSFIMYFHKRRFCDLKDLTIKQLFEAFEKILIKEKLEVPFSFNSGKGIFDISRLIKQLKN